MSPPLLASTGFAEHAAHVPVGITVLFAVILAAMIVALALEEKLHTRKSIITGSFAILSLLLASIFHEQLAPEGLLPFGPLTNVFHEPIDMPVYIPAIDWSVVVIILGSGLFVDVISKSGLFTWIAIKLTKASRGDPLYLLALYGGMTVLFSAALNNVTAMIIVGALTVVSLEKLGIRDKLLGFLLIEGLLTNVGGLLTLISSVPNIIVGTTAGISFLKFFVVAAPYTLIATVATILLGARMLGIRRITDEKEQKKAAERVAGFDERDGIQSMGWFRFATGLFVLFIIAIATTSVLPYVSKLGMGFVVTGFALVALLRYRGTVDSYYQVVDWDLLGFFIGLFVVINVMEHAQVLSAVGRGLQPILALGERWGAGVLLAAAAVASSVTDNIPLAAMLARILDGLHTESNSTFWWSVVFGGNLGGNLTPIGSASTIVAVTIMAKHDLPASFGRFVLTAIPYAGIQLAVAILYVMLVVPLFG